MNRNAFYFAEVVLRGYGQMFLANRAVCGGLILAGLFVLSPANALWSLIGACVVTAAASPAVSRRMHGFGAARADWEAGLFSVNGALLGYSWIYFAEVPTAAKGIMTVVGALSIAVVLTPLVRALRKRRSTLTAFSLPFVFAVWINVFALNQLGLYDSRFARGWHALAVGTPEEAQCQFSAIQIDTPAGLAYQHTGLGWAEYRLGQYTRAQRHFEQAIHERADLWDAYDGAGWCCWRLGQFDRARDYFQAAVAGNHWLASSWDGLGWLSWRAGDHPSAAGCFRKAILAAPLLHDAHVGLTQCRTPSGSRTADNLDNSFGRNLPARLQFLSSAQILCWVFFLEAIVVHSRTSALVALIGMAFCLLGSVLSDTVRRNVLDLNFLYNFFPLLLAFGGHYLRLTWRAICWTMAATLLLVLLWQPLAAWFLAIGLPLLCLPFNLLLLAGVVAAKRIRISGISVPLEIATTSPEEVQRWAEKVDLVNRCWDRLTPRTASVSLALRKRPRGLSISTHPSGR